MDKLICNFEMENTLCPYRRCCGPFPLPLTVGGDFLFATILSIESRINACFVPPTHGLFLTCTEGIFLFILNIYILHAMS
jgi:hypothetical protein